LSPALRSVLHLAFQPRLLGRPRTAKRPCTCVCALAELRAGEASLAQERLRPRPLPQGSKSAPLLGSLLATLILHWRPPVTDGPRNSSKARSGPRVDRREGGVPRGLDSATALPVHSSSNPRSPAARRRSFRGTSPLSARPTHPGPLSLGPGRTIQRRLVQRHPCIGGTRGSNHFPPSFHSLPVLQVGRWGRVRKDTNSPLGGLP
jgi:hypothetical protein